MKKKMTANIYLLPQFYPYSLGIVMLNKIDFTVTHRWVRYFKKVAERAPNAKIFFLSASALQGL